MNAPPRFPQHAPGEPPTCFNCHQQMPAGVVVASSGYAPRYGAYMALCGRCSLFTYFDILKGPSCSTVS